MLALVLMDLDIPSKAERQQNKKQTVGLHQTEKFLHNKGNRKKQRQLMEW
jgi:hypothetical protein